MFPRRAFLVVLSLLWVAPLFPVLAQENGTTNSNLSDAGEYLDAVEKLKNEPVPKQIDAWQKFLQDHPDTSFRSEIERNLKSLEDLLSQTDPQRKREQRDTERYLRAVEFSKKLNQSDQTALWQQFLRENPKSIYRQEVESNLEKLRAGGGVAPIQGTATPAGPQEPVARRLAYLDSQKAVLLATFPGLIVPGMGHWYTEEYVTAGVLTGIRVGSIALGIPMIVQRNTPGIIVASVIYGFTYLYDAIDTPFAVQRYNAEVEKSGKTSLWFDLDDKGQPIVGLAYRIDF
ncbi:MAG TPA: hypothetical protein VI895_08365 [Bdellovibrionota bacterium]|nr:hypothetical protein [Bdellovibrionota bacterium]